MRRLETHSDLKAISVKFKVFAYEGKVHNVIIKKFSTYKIESISKERYMGMIIPEMVSFAESINKNLAQRIWLCYIKEHISTGR